MKKCVMIAMMLVSALAFAQGTSSPKAGAQESSSAKISLAEARSRIDQVIASPETMTETMKQLTAEDQVKFLADVNKAVSSMPGSSGEKTALFVSLNLAAVASAEKGNSAALIAESFATVTPEALPAISEHFATDLLSRTAKSGVEITDAQFEKIAVNTMEKISERCEETDNGSPRTTFAILMFVRASGTTSETLVEHLVDTLKHEDAKEMATKEWIPAALGGEGVEANYEPLLSAADAGLRADYDATLVITGPQHPVAVIADLSGKNAEPDLFAHTMTPVVDAVENVLTHLSPNLGDEKLGLSSTDGAVNGAVIEGGGLSAGGIDTRPNPTNPDPKGTGHSPIVNPNRPKPQPDPGPGPVPPYWSSNQTMK